MGGSSLVGRVFFFTLFSSVRDALAALLRENGKDTEVVALMQGELLTLNLSFCKIGDDGAEIVAHFLKQDEIVKKVNLGSCRLGPHGAKAIADSLKHNQTVEEMHLYANPIGEEGADALMEALICNVCMEWFYVPVAPKFQETIEYLTKTRNTILIPAAVRRASLSLIAARRNTDAGNLAIFPKEIVTMIAMEVWATRREPIWINALTESEQTIK